MQQRQLRLGDILDDYCPRERRLTNHAVVAMVGDAVKQTRCTTCDAEHEYKHGKVPRQRRKAESPAALYNQVAAGAPKRVAAAARTASQDEHDDDLDVSEASQADDALFERGEHNDDTEVKTALSAEDERIVDTEQDRNEAAERSDERQSDEDRGDDDSGDDDSGDAERGDEEGPVHRPLIRASLPRPEGQPPPSRPIPEFTIRQPGGRPGRFRPRHQRSQQFQTNRSN